MEKGREHPVCSLIQRFREIFLELGLNEIINPIIVDERDVYLQYGSEAPLILDRVYYLAGLDRADIGFPNTLMNEVRAVLPKFNDKEKLQRLLRAFKEGKIESDDFVEELVKKLGIKDYEAIDLVERVFGDFKNLTPKPTRKTLRSHMTALWYKTLAQLQNREHLPIKLFSIGPRFRREQRQDSQHLFESTSASSVIMQDGFTLRDGEFFTSLILKKLGFTDCEFKQKSVTSNYYAPGTDTEVVIKCRGEEVEVANFGFYSSESLANYGIKHPVFNVGFGVERIAMLLEDVHDIRALVYPQFCPEIILMDEEIAKRIGACREPQTEQGKLLVGVLIECAIQNKDRIGPVDVLAFDGDFLSKHVKIWIYNWDTGKRMLSYASLNEVYVHDGCIIALPPKVKDLQGIPPHFLEVYEKGINTHLKLIDLLLRQFVAELEGGITRGDGYVNLKFKRVNRPKEINLKIPDHIYKYITGHRKKIQVGGPLFFGIKAEIIKEESCAT